MGQFIVKKRVTIHASPAQVWDALTDPEKTKEYFFHCRVYSDWREGSEITFKGKIFWIKAIEMKGRILRCEPQKLLQYTLKNTHSDDESSYSTVTDELIPSGPDTILQISDDVGPGEGAEKRYEMSEKGWHKVLKGLKELVETQDQAE